MTNIITTIILTLILIESDGRNIPGKNGEAGILQLKPQMVTEANRIAGIPIWSEEDRWNEDLSIQMCWEVLTWNHTKGYTNEIDLACRWNKYESACPTYRRNYIKHQSELQTSSRFIDQWKDRVRRNKVSVYLGKRKALSHQNDRQRRTD